MGRPRKVNRKRYAEFLIAAQTNWTQTYFADHHADFAHDAVNRYLQGERITARQVWEAVRGELQLSPNGFVIFDDSVLDKNHSRKIALVRKQWSGNEKRAIRGIGVVTCVYVNPDTCAFWIMDYRIFAPDQDGKTKLDHVQDMFRRALERCALGELAFQSVLMDTWYADKRLMTTIDRAGKYFCCPIKTNRNVSEMTESSTQGSSKVKRRYQRADTLIWNEESSTQGRTVHLRECAAGFTVKLFQVVLSTERTELIVTNDPTLQTVDDVRWTCAVRWKVEVFHREFKQITGVEACQCRSGRAQRNHIGCAVLVWIRLKHLARTAQTTIYALKQGLLSEYMRRELLTPTLSFA